MSGAGRMNMPCLTTARVYHSAMLLPRILCALTTALLLYAVHAGPDDTALRPYEAEYDLTRGMLRVGKMVRRLDVDAAGAYVFESRMETKGLAALFSGTRVIETSRGRIAAARFVPERYEYDRGDAKRDYRLQFDYDNGTVHRADARSDWSTAMPGPLFDKLVYQAQLMLDLPAGPATIQYAIADKSRLKTYEIRNLGNERVETEAGKFDAVLLERASAGSKRRTRVWCAAELGWLPVKVEHRDKKGNTTTALLRSLHAP